MRTRDLVSSVAVGVAAGYVGTGVMNSVTTMLYQHTPEADKQREKAVSPGSPYKIGVEKAAGLAGVELDEKQVEAAAALMPYTVGVAGGLLYVGLRRILGVKPWLGGLLSGMALFLIVDEWLTPTLRLSAPNSAYPISTHGRGFFGHLAYGAAVAASAEALGAKRE